MKYVIKCSYCDHSYIVDSQEERENFECPKCTGQNGVKDVVERIQKPVIITETRIKEVKVPTYAPAPADTPTEEDSDSKLKSFMITFGFIVILIIFSAMFQESLESTTTVNDEIWGISAETKAARNESASKSAEANVSRTMVETWITALNEQDINTLYNCYYIPLGSIYSVEDFEKWVLSGELKDLWGSNVDVRDITFDGFISDSSSLFEITSTTVKNISRIYYDVTLTNGETLEFKFDKTNTGQMKIRFWDYNTQTDVMLKTAVPILSNKYEHTTINNQPLIGDNSITTDDEGQSYYLYTIPLIPLGEYCVQVETVLGTLSMPINITAKSMYYEIDKLEVDSVHKQTIAAELQNIWQSVQNAAFNYADPAEFREYFHDRITDEELEKLAKQIRMEQDLRGNYENATVTKVTIPDWYFCSIDYNTFILPVAVRYETTNPDHASGTRTSKLTVTYTENGWQIYETYDNSFFTLMEGEGAVE